MHQHNLENAVAFCSHPEREGIWTPKEEGDEKDNKPKKLNMPGIILNTNYQLILNYVSPG